jgi:hypothetical protein
LLEALLMLLAVGHFGYEPLASLLDVLPTRVFYIFQGVIGAAFFALAGLTLHRPHWPSAARWALYLVALWGLAEQTLVVTCGCARLWNVTFRAPPGQGLCGGNWYGVGLAVVAWLAMVVWTARKVER